MATARVIEITISKEQPINQKDCNVKEFVDKCFKTADKLNLRIGINDIMKEYKKWCKNNSYNLKTRTYVKQSLQNVGFKEELSKGVDLNGNNGKRGFNIELNII